MITAIIQARMGSTRLPGKMMKEIAGKPLIWHIINRVKQSKLINKIILATTNKEEDKVLVEKAREYSIETFTGSENDVLDRYYQAAKKFNGKTIVRITGDCPFMDPQIIDQLIQDFLKNRSEIDYISNIHPPTYPDGFDVEVFSFAALEKAWKEAKLTSEREHVTPYIWKKKQLFKTRNIKSNENLSNLRLTVDEEKDLILINQIRNRLNKTEFYLKDILRIIKENPQLTEINKKFQRNEGYKKSLEEDNVIKNFKQSSFWLEKAKRLIPAASQTYSKSYKYFCEGVAPAFLEHGKGSHVWDVDGNEYIDFVLGLGAITLGYNNKEVNEAVMEQLRKGISFSQSNIFEVKLAQKLTEIIPCAKMVKFVKNGSDATTAAIRLARAYTGRDIIACCGYHGYHDWYIGTTENDLGVPKTTKELTETFEYNNIKSLKKMFEKNKGKVAAAILEPCQAQGPENNFLEEVKELTHKNGAILIFDEVVSGFRMNLGGAQEYYKVTPDLSCFGKGMGNGLAISAVVGKTEIMKLIDEGAFISTTFGGETLALAGALATIKVFERSKTFKHIIKLGNMWLNEVKKLINEKNLTKIVEMYGISPHCGVLFKDIRNLSGSDLLSVYQQTLTKKGILSIGVNNFCLSHTKKDVKKFINAVDIALDIVKNAVEQDSVEGILEGKKFRPVFGRN